MRGERIAGRHRPARGTPFDGLGSSSISVKIVCILGYSYGTLQGAGGGLCAPSLPWIRVCMRIMHLCVSIEFICLSVCLSISLFISLSI